MPARAAYIRDWPGPGRLMPTDRMTECCPAPLGVGTAYHLPGSLRPFLLVPSPPPNVALLLCFVFNLGWPVT